MKFLFTFLTLVGVALGQIMPAKPVVQVMHSINITATSNITCPTTGYVGSFTGCGTTSVVYTAPSSIIPQKVEKGLQIVPNNSFYVTPMNNLPVDANSATKINTLVSSGATSLTFEPSWGIGLQTSGSSTFVPVPRVTSTLNVYPYGSYPDSQYSPWYAQTEASPLDGVSGYVAVGGNNADHHTLIVNPSTGHIYEYYNRYLNTTLRTCNGCTAGTYNSNVNAAQDYIWSQYAFTNGPTNGIIDASGALVLPLTVTGYEILNGIHHILRMTASLGDFNYSANNWPATAYNSPGSGCTATTCLAYGDIIHIKNSVIASLKSSVCGSDAGCQNLLTALNVYGAMITDIGAPSGSITYATDPSLDLTVQNSIYTANSTPLNSTDWEKVNTQSLEVSATSNQVCPINQSCMNGTQSYQTPVSDAWVSVSGVIYPIAIQGVGLGLGSNWPFYVPVLAGTSFQIPTTVTGSSNTGVLWSVASGVGTITSGGLYTPPSSVSSPTLTVLKCISQSDNNVILYFYANVIPSSSPALIQDDTQASSNTTDANSNVWLADLGEDNIFYQIINSAFSTTQTAQATQQNSFMFYFGDWRKYYIVPNGNYLVNIYLGDGEAPFTNGSWPNNPNNINGNARNIFELGPYDIEVNGQIQKHQYDWSLASQYFFGWGNVITVPATVTNNLLEFGLYATTPDITTSDFLCSGCLQYNFAPSNGNKFGLLGAVSLQSDGASPYLGIDVSNLYSSLPASGGKIQVWPIDGHINLPLGPGTVTWSLVAPYPTGTTITSNTWDNGAIVSLPSGSYRNSDLIQVKAVYGTHTATKEISITGGTPPLMELH